MTNSLDSIRKIVLENKLEIVDFKDVPYDTGSVFKSAEFLKKASRIADKETGEPLPDYLNKLVNDIDENDEDFIAVCSSWKEDTFLNEPWLEENVSSGHTNNQDEDVPDTSSMQGGISSADFHRLVKQYLDAGFSEYMARHKAMQRLGQAA